MKRNKINATSVTMHPIFLEDYFVSANYFTNEMQHVTRFKPLSELVGFVPEDYKTQIEAILSDPNAEYVQNWRRIFYIKLLGAPPIFEKMASYFASKTTVSSLVIIKCFGWRFEHSIEITQEKYSPWQVDQPKIYSPWQVNQDNINLSTAEVAVTGVLSGTVIFQNE